MIGSEDGKKHRDDLNVVVVVDVSGSMDSCFSGAYKNYNSEGSSGNSRPPSKLDVAKKCLKKLFQTLNKNERFGVVSFSDTAAIVQPLRSG